MEELISSAKDYKDELYKQLSRIGKCLSSDKRLEILNLLAQGPKTVEKLTQDTGMNVANVSRHLQVLNDSRLVKFTKKGTYAIYSLADPSVVEFLFSLWHIAENQLSDITRIKEDFFGGMEGLYTLTMDQVYEKLNREDVVLLDLRPTDEYNAGHIEGAVSVPMEKLDVYLQQLPRDKEVVAYCRGQFCAFSAIAAQKMKNQGFMAYRMAESFHEWQKYLELKQ
ncbi:MULTISPECIES: ArsR/SmtB family transcription factor [Peribacillus]|uniref:ArsR/SmtB family transcription factor n=1 Tax=Peribacillus TaxID=2675229 RepID=UPI001F4EE342|nr:MULTISPECIES: metalloregulator ArsR/SmtB family transcription factor [unclassified Peribacillus]MCK1982753.1 metalloregulator ArsR/SmtB family transcription factor [Peribacillus sp. Aquil_B1]MCK2010317.1 metalloregulator ArsR/SmtB family transcription factor [Peribacillus sp. Aquil_B8]